MTSTTTMTPLHCLPQKYNNNNSNLTHSFSHVRRAAAYCSAVVIVKMHNFFSFFFFEGEWHFYCLIFLLSAASLAVAGISSLPWYTLCALHSVKRLHSHEMNCWCIIIACASRLWFGANAPTLLAGVHNVALPCKQHIIHIIYRIHDCTSHDFHMFTLASSFALFSLSLSLLYMHAHSRVSMRAHCKHNITNHNSQMLCETHKKHMQVGGRMKCCLTMIFISWSLFLLLYRSAFAVVVWIWWLFHSNRSSIPKS